MRLLKQSSGKNRVGSARAQINIKGVRGEVLLLSKNSYCGVIETSSLNFELKSEAEQDALIETYQSFLNGLGFQLQIIIRVREIDLDHYFDELEERSKQEQLLVYRDQIDNYALFVRSLVSSNRILSRHFYVVVPIEITSHHDFEFACEQLALKTEIVEKGLMRLGMNIRPLNGLEILNLFYTFYNPRLAKTQPLEDAAIRAMHTAIVKDKQ